ncbi:MAG: hypothetical protein D6738_00500 [Acidobacteria bacterium]|nr:MAG: hypothetical protein D6738_00500 [Acidobacteriota bacterium]
MRFLAVRRVRRWLASSWQSRSWERLDGLPLPRIDRNWSERASWLPAALECLALARALRDRQRIPLAVAVTFALVPTRSPRGVHFRSVEEFTAELDESPPSLMLLDPEQLDPAGHDDPTVRTVHPGIFGLDPADGWRAELREWRFPDEAGGEVFRSVLIGALP